MGRMMLAAALAAGASAVGAGFAAAQSSVVQDPVPIGPNQPFLGSVNGVSSNAVIRMACFGPVHPGETGHPMAGQTVEVRFSSAQAGPGFTGTARRIAAVLSYPTPVANPVATVLATFSSYYVPAPISTALTLPCYGSGRVTFSPLNGGAKARAAVVKVSFVGQP